MHTQEPIHYWQLQDAKARLSEVVKLATSVGPQGISVRGQPEAVVISAQAFAELTGSKTKFIDFMKQSPLFGCDLDLTRDKSTDRGIDL